MTFNVTGLPQAAPADVSVTFTLSPLLDWAGDLDVKLIAPNGASQTILSQTGVTIPSGCGDDSDISGPYTFADDPLAPPSGGWWQAATAAGASTAIAPGTYRATAPGGADATNPAPATELTAAFAGVANPNGTWTLRFIDGSAGSVGTVASANLRLINGTVVTPPTLPTPDTTAPETAITSGPKARTTKKNATIEFSSEAGATVQCSLNSAAFAPCTSPDAVTSKKGKNTFQVRATDTAGNVDATPATTTWKVVKKKKHH